MCGMIAVQAQIIWGANPIPSGPRAAVTIHAAGRHVRACRQIVDEGSDGGALATPGGGVGSAASMCGRRPIGEFNEKCPRRISPCGLFAIFAMMALCR
jgi:hypothetical protein